MGVGHHFYLHAILRHAGLVVVASCADPAYFGNCRAKVPPCSALLLWPYQRGLTVLVVLVG